MRPGSYDGVIIETPHVSVSPFDGKQAARHPPTAARPLGCACCASTAAAVATVAVHQPAEYARRTAPSDGVEVLDLGGFA
ncbi:hypothetical protein GCM10010121_087960 [Streptomyces brasiliensis]|uniref:Uncharacterized protein n=1 Tax=Streptomyces brasiliensis TaxID=1954 RepID=A0A917P6C7_9ACTN|nr:hypothetical protein GCM10010121_087960 [Streptomyces brasiliensis]